MHPNLTRVALLGTLLAVILTLSTSPAALAFALGTAADGTTDDASWLVQPAGPLGGADSRTYLVHDLQPGQTAADAISITNHGDTDLTLRVLATDAYSDPESGAFSLLPSDDAPRDAGAWVQLAASKVTIPAHAKAELPVVISVPTNATPGDHAGGIVTSYTSDAVDPDGQPILVEARIAMRLYLHIAGKRMPSISVEDITSSFSVDGDQLTGSLTIGYTARNTGNTRLRADEAVRVTGPFGVGLREAPGSQITELLPGGHVRREIVLRDVPAALALDTEVTLTPADLSDADHGLESASSSTRTWAMPWVLVSALLILGGLLWWSARRRQRWRVLRAELAAVRAAA